MANIKSVKKALRSKKLSHKKTNYLELLIKEDKRKYTKLSLPIKIVRASVKQPLNKKVYHVKIEPESVLNLSIKIDNMQSKNFIPQNLCNKKIHFIRENKKMEGIIVHANIRSKVPEGEPVPNPPQPIH